MTWTKLSDDFMDDTWTLSNEAHRLHIEGHVWSNRKLLDLRIPKDDLRRFKTPEAIGELVSGGWWSDEGDHYLILHHARYQRLREAVINQQTVNKENRAKRGQESAPTREQGVKFKPANDSLHDSTNEMDGTGRAGITGTSENEESQDVVNTSTGEVTSAKTSQAKTSGDSTEAAFNWDVAAIPDSTSDHDVCAVCDNTLVSPSARALGVCRRGDPQHVAARELFKQVA